MNEIRSISDRIAVVLSERKASPAEISDLLQEASGEAARLRAGAAKARDTALDPRKTGAAVQKLRREAEDAEFEADRIGQAVVALEEFEEEAEARAAAEGARAAYDDAVARRDAVAERIRIDYPQIAADLMSLIGAIVASNKEIVTVNRELPDGCEPILQAEQRARGFRRRSLTHIVNPPLIAQMMVPAFDPAEGALHPDGWRNGAKLDLPPHFVPMPLEVPPSEVRPPHTDLPAPRQAVPAASRKGAGVEVAPAREIIGPRGGHRGAWDDGPR